MHGTKGAPKLIDVARLADCSPTTVSRVLNDQPFVTEPVRLRVREAAEKLGYVPNGSARALRSTRSRIVGIVIPTLKHAIYAELVETLQAQLSKQGVSLIIGISSYDLKVEYIQVTTLVERGAEAIVLVGARHLKETTDLLTSKRILSVFTYTSELSGAAAAIGFDNRRAGAMAAEFLHSYGHRRMGMIAGLTKDNDRAAGRRDGYVSALTALGIPFAAIAVVEASYSLEGGNAAMRSLLQSPTPPTAVFCGSDILAAGAVKYCMKHGVAVPKDVSIIGFDNMEIAELSSPELTTIHTPSDEMGRLTAEYILSTSGQRDFMRHRELATRLVVRDTTGPAPS